MDSTFELDSRQLASLLEMAQCTSGDLLNELLVRIVSLDPADADSVPAVTGSPGDALDGCTGRTVREVLLDPATGVAALAALKDYAKCIVRRARTEAERAAGTALYYAAIAAALVSHNERVTEYSPQKLADGLAGMSGRDWLPPEIKALLDAAREKCSRPS